MELRECIQSVQSESPFLNSQDLVYQVLIREILSMRIPSGEKISQGRLSSDFNLSRGPVRTALERLEREGFVARDEAGAFSVSRPSQHFISNVLSFKRQLDLLAAHQAAYRITKAQSESIQKELEDMSTAIDLKDPAVFSAHDIRFHMIIVSASDNPLLEETYRRYRSVFHFIGLFNEDDRGALKRLYLCHMKIYKAILTQKHDAIKSAMDEHYSVNSIF